ncbi:MAG TPA: alpha/beta fold hydrolase [Tepidisphaeraceae bacterium]|jgi:fermentation-respiration switch protein FrsA (DUF1100 family)
MLPVLHWIILALYLALPAAAFIHSIARRSQCEKGTFRSLLFTALAGVVLSLAMSLVYATVSGGRVLINQVLIGAYFAVGLLLLLKGFDYAVRWMLRKILRLETGKAIAFALLRMLLGALVRVVIVAGIGLPYIMSSAMTYRVKVGMADDPERQLGFDFERVQFRATDGTRIVGWWIPAMRTRKSARQPDEQWGTQTVLVCHGLGANKSNQLVMARDLIPAGYNVLAFDFRASGESGGQLSTFGDLERRDVLGAVHWLRESQPRNARKIFGLGASMGGAALIAAASDNSDEGRAIEAVATYAAYDSLEGLAQSVTEQYFIPPLGWLLMNVGMPLASAQTGSDLSAFSPATLAPALWPRPLLVIHGVKDRIIPFERAEQLYDHATIPRYYLWLQKGDHNDLITDDAASRTIIQFFRDIQASPVI